MLFSRADVSGFLNRYFESSWEMVRPVPVVKIDFGNGHVAQRTLHGNIASYVCAADGQVLDILPGIYTPTVYQAALQQLRYLALALNQRASYRPEDYQNRLRGYHQERARTLRNQPGQIVFAPRPQDWGKQGIEGGFERVVLQAPTPELRAERAGGFRPPPTGNLADWDLLAVDTWNNETQRRLVIHERLAEANPVRPEQIKKWLYKEVLHSDLDDPYLGLGDVLFTDDFFREGMNTE